MFVKVSKKKYEIKNDELQLIILERNETNNKINLDNERVNYENKDVSYVIFRYFTTVLYVEIAYANKLTNEIVHSYFENKVNENQ